MSYSHYNELKYAINSETKESMLCQGLLLAFFKEKKKHQSYIINEPKIWNEFREFLYLSGREPIYSYRDIFHVIFRMGHCGLLDRLERTSLYKFRNDVPNMIIPVFSKDDRDIIYANHLESLAQINLV